MYSVAVKVAGRHPIWDGTGFPKRRRTIVPRLPHTPDLQCRCFKRF